MRSYSVHEFVRSLRSAPYLPKQEWIISLVRDKEVLDLGVVDHSIDCCLHHKDRWLHGAIRTVAKRVVGVDILEKEVKTLRSMGYDVVCGDATSLDLGEQFDVVVCGDLIEHVSDLGGLLRSIRRHLKNDGFAIITTPNPFAVARLFNIIGDGWTDINQEHVMWICPQTMFQLAARHGFYVDEFCWLQTHYTMPTRRRYWGWLFNRLAQLLVRRRPMLHTDFGVVLRQSNDQSEHWKPFVSVILPTYNRAYQIAATLNSLLDQDYPRESFEIIVVDNMSTDDTDKAIRALFDPYRGTINLKYIREPRKGLQFARHTGAAHAKGEILLFGDDDARFASNWISEVVKIYSQYPKVGAVGTKIAIDWDSPPAKWMRNYERLLGELDYGDSVVVRRGLFINGASFSIRKELLLKAGGFNPGQRGEYVIGDSESGLCRKLAKLGIPVAWTPYTTVWHLQTREKHGTYEDIKRRHVNEAYCNAYAILMDSPNVIRPLKAALAEFVKYIKCLCRSYANPRSDSFRYDRGLRWAYLKAFYRYVFLYFFDEGFKKALRCNEGEFSESYMASPIICESRVDSALTSREENE